MSHLRDAQSVLRLAASSLRQPFVCRACRAHAIRQLHTSNSRQFLKAMRESLFGSKESIELEQKREEKTQEHARRDAAKEELQTIQSNRGKTYEVAAIVDPSINPEYVMSTNWKDLRHIGSKKWIQKRKDVGGKYVGFMPKKRITLSDNQWASLLHHITVEILALKAANRDLHDICLARSAKLKPWTETRRTTVVSDQNTGQISLRFESNDSQKRILEAIPQAEFRAAASPETSEQGEEEFTGEQNAEQDLEDTGFVRELKGATARAKFEQYSNSNPWTAIPLREPVVKLVILKRIMQLTGQRIPDPILSNANTLADLYNALKAKEPAKKLAKTDEMQRLDVNAPNVVVHSKRRTPIDKEKEIGRWNLIKDELIARDLPVTGTRWKDAKPRIGVSDFRKGVN